MDIEVLHRPDAAMGVIKLGVGEGLQAEAGAMVSMSSGIEIETKAKGGLLGGLKRSVLGGESFFLNTFNAPQGGEVMVAPSLPGDVVAYSMTGPALMVQSGSYMASATAIEVDTKWGGAKTFFGGEGLFMLRCTGTGELILSSYGAIHEMELGTGESLKVDTGHVVAFQEGVTFEVQKVGGWKSTFFSGEGLVVNLTGPGKIMLQTRSPQGLLGWLIPQLPKPSN